jgi:hypothetical protein
LAFETVFSAADKPDSGTHGQRPRARRYVVRSGLARILRDLKPHTLDGGDINDAGG